MSEIIYMSYYNYSEQLDIPSNKKPQNIHLIWELVSGNLIFVDSADNTKVYHLDVSTNTLTQLDVDPSDTSGDNKSRDHTIQAGWHDEGNTIIWFVDCDNLGDNFDVWKLDYSVSETAPTITEVGTSTTGDVGTVGAYDIFIEGSDVFVHHCEIVTATGFISNCISEVDTAPFTLEANNALDNRIYPSKGIVTGTKYYYFVDYPTNSFVWVGEYDDNTQTISDHNAVGEYLSNYSFSANDSLWGISYDENNTLYIVLEKDADSLNYLCLFTISTTTLSDLGIRYDIALMLDRDSISTDNPPFNLEKAICLTEMKVYQIAKARGNVNYISYLENVRPIATCSLIAITDTYLIVDNNGTIELWKIEDRIAEVIDCQGEHPVIGFRNSYSDFIMYVRDTLADYLDVKMFIQIIGHYSSYFNTGLLAFYNAPDNFNDETAGAITVAGDMDWIDTITLPNTCSAALGTIDDHKNVLGITHDGGADDPIVTHTFDAQNATGTYEWWWGSSDVVHNQVIRFRGTGIAIYLRINASKYYYVDSVDAEIEIVGDTPTNDELDHFKLIWDCVTDTFDLYINETIRVTAGEFNNADTYIDELYMACISNNVATQYIDAPGNVADDDYYEGQNLIKTDENGVIMEGFITKFDDQDDPAVKFWCISHAAYELSQTIHITDYTNYTGKTTGPLITQLLADYCQYITTGTISAGAITWTCPDDWEARGSKQLITIIKELCEDEDFLPRLRPTGELDIDDGATDTHISIASTDQIDPLLNKPTRSYNISENINYVRVFGGIDPITGKKVGTDTPITAEDVPSQQLTGKNIWIKTYAGEYNTTNLQTKADNILTISPKIIDIAIRNTIVGFFQSGEIVSIGAEIYIHNSTKTLTVGTYIVWDCKPDVKNGIMDLKLQEGLYFEEDPNESLAEQNSQLILQVSEAMQKGVHPNPAPAKGDHSAEGITVTFTAGENLVFGEICYFKSDGKCWKADSSATTTLPVMVIALATIAADATGEFLLYGFVRDDSWNWTVGGKVYLSSTAGSPTQTVPAGEEVQTIGIATHADRMIFNPNYVNVSDVTYDATSWNGNNDPATKDVIRDKIEALGGCSIATGTYTGNGNNNREINVGFTGKYVMINWRSGGAVIWTMQSNDSFASWKAARMTYDFDWVSNRLYPSANGFELNNSDAGDNYNVNAQVYYYVCWG